MLKDVICKLDYSNFEEIALVIFGLCFFAICWQAWRLNSDASSRFGSIPIDDLVPAVQTAPAIAIVDDDNDMLSCDCESNSLTTVR